MFAEYFTREIPARSAAAYVHQLQKNATILGSHSCPFPGAVSAASAV